MKLRLLLPTAILVFALALLAAACGDDGGPSENGGERGAIRTQKGLSVAALSGSLGGSEDDSANTGGEAPSPSLPPGADTGVGRDSIVGPDIAPFPFTAPLQDGQTGLTVQGFGSATADADSAVLEFYFGSKITDVEPVPRGEPGSTGGGVAPSEPVPPSATPISESDLQPVVDAIVAQGVSRDDIEVLTVGYDPYYSSATIRVTVSNLDSVQAIVDAVTSAAASLENASLQGNSVSYTVADCAALERAAMQAAVDDARERATAFAQVLSVGLGSIVGASNYSYAPYGGTPCGNGYGVPVPLGGVAYAESSAPAVQVVANVAITFAIQ